MASLREQGLYEDTLVVFTTDNGGETARGASDYSFRGTKGELWEGNTRVLASLSGGVLEKLDLLGGVRTLLDFVLHRRGRLHVGRAESVRNRYVLDFLLF